MNRNIYIIFTFCMIVLLLNNCAQEANFFNSPHAYLGQTPPGLKPQVFAPGIVASDTNRVFSCTFTPDGKEFYFNRDGNIMMCRFDGNVWRGPAYAPFNTDRMDHEPHITVDGKTVFFGSNRPQPGNDAERQYCIWTAERIQNGWGDPVHVGSGMYVTTSRLGDIFITRFEEKDANIALVKMKNGIFSEYENLDEGVNSPYDEMHPGVAPDGSYIVFDSNRPGSHQGDGAFDLYISFKQADGTWGDAVNIGEKLNINAENIAACISPDGKYLFYNSMNGDDWDIFWVDTKFLQSFKPESDN